MTYLANLFKCNCLGADLLNNPIACVVAMALKKRILCLNRKVSFVVTYYLSENPSKILELGIMKVTFAPRSAVVGRVI